MNPRGYCWLMWAICLLSVLTYCIADARTEMAVVGLLGCSLAALLMWGGLPRGLPRISINLLVIGATAWVLLQVSRAGVPTVTEMTDFLVWILLIKMFDRGRPRDEAQLLGLSVFVTIGAVLTSNSLGLGLMLLILAPMMIAGAVGLQLYSGVWADVNRRTAVREHQGLPADPDPLRGVSLVESRRGRRDLWTTWAGAVFACGVLSVAAFIASPRTLTQQVLGSLGEVRAGAQTDFRDRIDLGVGGTISTSEEPVMDVTLLDDLGHPVAMRDEPIYLRGAVLDYYDADHRQWRSAVPEQNIVLARSGDASPISIRQRGGGEAVGPKLTQQIVIRYARENTPLFAVWRAMNVSVEDGKIGYYPDDVVLRHETGGRLAYTVVSSPIYNGPPARPYLSDAEDVPKAVRQLALDLAKKAGVSPSAAERETADTRRLVSSFVTHLREQYPYDLEQQPAPPDVDPVEFFLFQRKRGHCEYFAAALTSLLRCVGVPSRIVTGYAAGEFNPIAGSFIVRKSDAHAWVEASIRSGRWETLDATPPGSLATQQRASRGLLSRLRQIWEAMELSWINNVVAFDAKTKVDLGDAFVGQKNRFGAIRAVLQRFSAWWNSLIPGLGPWPGIVLAIAAAVFVMTGGTIAVRRSLTGTVRRLALTSTPRPDTPAERTYAKMLKVLDHAGLSKPVWQPPLRHASQLRGAADQDAISTLAAQMTRDYYAHRFGGRAWDESQRSRSLAELEQACARRRQEKAQS